MIYCIFPLKRKRFLLKIQHRSATFSGPRANKKSSSITIVKMVISMLKVAKKHFVIFCIAIIFIIALILLYPKSARMFVLGEPKKAPAFSCKCLNHKGLFRPFPWSHLGLNQGPPDYESGATNQLSYGTVPLCITKYCNFQLECKYSNFF